MFNRHQFSSSQTSSRYPSQDTRYSTSGAQSEQSSYRSSSFGGGWGRPNGNSRHQADGGGGWGRPPHAPAAASGGWGSRLASTEASRQQPQQPQQQELEKEQSFQLSAPQEGYDYEFVVHSFKQKFDISHEYLPVLDQVVQTYITRNPLRYGLSLKDAIDRALLRIHEELQINLEKPIPEKDSNPRALTIHEEFVLKLTQTLSSYGHSSPKDVNQFVAKYMRTPLSELLFPDTIDQDTMRPICLRSSEVYTDQHMTHAIHTYFLSQDLSSILKDKFGFVDGKMPSQLFRQLHLDANVRKLIKSAINEDGRVMNGFLMICPYDTTQNNALRKKLLESLITHTQQSNYFHIVSLTTKGPPTTGDICLVIPDKIYTQTKFDKNSSNDRIMTKKPSMSQYKTQGPKGCILLGMNQVLDWNIHGIKCSFQSTNMQLPMGEFCTILSDHWGAIPLFLEDKSKIPCSRQSREESHAHEQFSHHLEDSSAGGGWGAAAPK